MIRRDPSGRALRVLAPCKVNLTLDVGMRRPDGYHDLDSLVAIFLPGDELTVSVIPGPRAVALTCDDPSLPTGDTNLAHRAATAFLDCGRAEQVVRIHLAKRLPHQAGLGGGSSDAAATLRALSHLLPDAVPPESLPELAASIGSDVPLFLAPHTRALHLRGRGESVTSLPLPPLHGVVVKPFVGIATRDAYALLDALPGRTPGRATDRLLTTLHAGGDINAVGAALGNDFEAVVLPAFPAVADAHRLVSQAGAVRALLCGSGSAVFGLAQDRAHADALASHLGGRFPWVQIVEPLEVIA